MTVIVMKFKQSIVSFLIFGLMITIYLEVAYFKINVRARKKSTCVLCNDYCIEGCFILYILYFTLESSLLEEKKVMFIGLYVCNVKKWN